MYVVDNGGQWTHREWRVLRYLKVDTKIVPNTVPFEDISDADGLVLSGGAPSVSVDSARMGNNGVFVDEADFPILGICAGMQFLCEHFGGKVGSGSVPEFGGVDIEVRSHDDIFAGLPDGFKVWASHNDEVKELPDGFEAIASSATCPNEAVRCVDRPIYGVQFHPEVENTEHGVEIFKNFLRIVEERGRPRRGRKRNWQGFEVIAGRTGRRARSPRFCWLIVSSWLITCQMTVLPCSGMLGSLARSSRMTIALVARTSMASLVSRSLALASVAPFLMFLGMDVSSASMSRTSVTCLTLSAAM